MTRAANSETTCFVPRNGIQQFTLTSVQSREVHRFAHDFAQQQAERKCLSDPITRAILSRLRIRLAGNLWIRATRENQPRYMLCRCRVSDN